MTVNQVIKNFRREQSTFTNHTYVTHDYSLATITTECYVALVLIDITDTLFYVDARHFHTFHSSHRL